MRLKQTITSFKLRIDQLNQIDTYEQITLIN